MQRLLTLALLLCGSFCHADDPPRLTLSYNGSARMPTVASSSKGSNFGSTLGPVARRPDGTFLVYGLYTQQEACIINVPRWGSTSHRNAGQVPQAMLVKGWHDPTNGKLTELNAEYAVSAGQGYRVGGVTYDSASNAYFVCYRWYNVQNASLPSLFRVAANGSVSPAYYCGNFHSLKTAYMITQDASGNIWSGQSNPIANGTAGPSAFKLDAFDVTLSNKAQQPATEFLSFPLNAPLQWQAPEPLVNGDQFYRNKPNEKYRPEPQEWFGPTWNCRTMFVCGSSICYVVQRPLGPAWYGNFVASDGVTNLESSNTTTRGYNAVAWATSIYEFPYLMTSGGTDKRYREVAGLQHRLFELDSSVCGNFNAATGDLFLLESNADRVTAYPVLHWFTVKGE